MCDVAIWWDASGRFSQGPWQGEFLSEEPHPPPSSIEGTSTEGQGQPAPGDILPVPFLDDGIAYLVQIIRRLPGYLKGAGLVDFTHLIFGTWEVGRCRTCFIGPYPYLFRVLEVLDDDDDDSDDEESDSDDSDFSNGTPQSNKTVSTLPLYTMDDYSLGPHSHALNPKPPDYDTLYQWSGDGPSSSPESPVRGRSRTRGEHGGRFRLRRDAIPVHARLPSPSDWSPHEGHLFAGSFGAVLDPRIDISPDRCPPQRSDPMFDAPRMEDPPSLAEIPIGAPRHSRETSLSPLIDFNTAVQLPDNPILTRSHSKSQRPPPTQDPIGTPRRAGFIPILGNQAEYGSPLPALASIPPNRDPSRLTVPQTRTVPRSPLLDIINHAKFSGSPHVGGSPYDRKYTADLVADEEGEYTIRSPHRRYRYYSLQVPRRAPLPNGEAGILAGCRLSRLLSPTQNNPAGSPWSPPPGISCLVGQIDLAEHQKLLARTPAFRDNEPLHPAADLCPRSPGFRRSPIPQQFPLPVSPLYIKSPAPRTPEIGNLHIVQYLEELVDSGWEADEENADFYLQSPKTRFARDFPADELDVKECPAEYASPGLDRFLTERRLLSPEPTAVRKYHTPHDMEDHPHDKVEEAQPNPDQHDDDSGFFEDFPVGEMSIAMGLHSGSRRGYIPNS